MTKLGIVKDTNGIQSNCTLEYVYITFNSEKHYLRNFERESPLCPESIEVFITGEVLTVILFLYYSR